MSTLIPLRGVITPTKPCANVKMEGGDILRFKTDMDLRGPQGPEQSYTVTSLPYNYYLKTPEPNTSDS